MAVFPDKIVLKNSIDAKATIEAAIANGGTDAITAGELVIGRESGAIRLYSVDSAGNIQSVSAGSTTLAGLTDVDTGGSGSSATVYRFDPLAGYTGGRVLVNPNASSAYTFAGLSSWDNGNISLVGGASSTARATATFAADEKIYFHPDPTTNGVVPTDYTINIEVNGTSGQRALYRTEPTLGTGTSDLVIPTMGQVRAYADSVGGGGALNDLTDVTISAPSNGEALVYNGSAWVNSTVSTVGSIDDLSDVDTMTISPSVGQVLEWDGSNWIPGTASAGGGGIAGTVLQKTETQTASSGAATFVELGASGTLVSVTSSLDAWIVLYATAAARTADSGRSYGTDPAAGSGVLAEFYVTASGTVLASPGTTYFNNDTSPTDALYAAVRDQAGASVNADVTIKAYVHQNFAGVGTNRISDSGVAASGSLDLTGMGQSGQLCTITSSLDAWIVLYGSAADRTADASRNYGTDPSPGSGVQAEFYITSGTTVLVTPGSVYYNNDTSPTEAMYLAVRDQSKVAVNATVTITAYAETSFTGVSGGTFGSG